MLDRIRKSLRLNSDEGATAVEYGIMVALIAAVIVLVVLVLGKQVKTGFCDTSTALASGGVTATGASAADC